MSGQPLTTTTHNQYLLPTHRDYTPHLTRLRFIHRTTTPHLHDSTTISFVSTICCNKKRAYTGAQHYKKFGHHGGRISPFSVLVIWRGAQPELTWVRGERYRVPHIDTPLGHFAFLFGLVCLSFFFPLQSIASGRPEAMGLWIGKLGLEWLDHTGIGVSGLFREVCLGLDDHATTGICCMTEASL